MGWFENPLRDTENAMNNQKLLRLLGLGGLAMLILLILIFTLHPNLALNQDLGRHLKLGKIIWETKSVPTTNLFSYTHPNFPFINHHWLAEVSFYLLNSLGGVLSITVLKIVLIVGAFLLAFALAKKLSNPLTALISATLLIPLFIERTHERPEMFGFLFFALLLYLLFSKEKPSKKNLLFVPMILLLWVNFHLSFIYGVFLVGIFFLKSLWLRHKSQITQRDIFFYIAIAVASTLITLLNPNGLRGALYPFTIFSNYGYRIIENQTVFFLFSRISDPIIIYFLIIAPLALLIILTTLSIALKNRSHNPDNHSLPTITYSLFLLSLVFAILSFWAVRNFSFFALAAIPALAIALQMIAPGSLLETLKENVNLKTALLSTIIIVNLGLAITLITQKSPRLLVAENYKPGVDFFLQNRLPANIFNNFDIGGYLDYRLYPKYRVFVDNRPEAFPADFFDTYKTMQQDPNVRREIFDQHNINSIIFAHTDITPWAGEFLKQITADPEWKTVYFDPTTVIFVKSDYPLPSIPLTTRSL